MTETSFDANTNTSRLLHYSGENAQDESDCPGDFQFQPEESLNPLELALQVSSTAHSSHAAWEMSTLFRPFNGQSSPYPQILPEAASDTPQSSPSDHRQRSADILRSTQRSWPPQTPQECSPARPSQCTPSRPFPRLPAARQLWSDHIPRSASMQQPPVRVPPAAASPEFDSAIARSLASAFQYQRPRRISMRLLSSHRLFRTRLDVLRSDDTPGHQNLPGAPTTPYRRNLPKARLHLQHKFGLRFRKVPRHRRFFCPCTGT